MTVIYFTGLFIIQDGSAKNLYPFQAVYLAGLFSAFHTFVMCRPPGKKQPQRKDLHSQRGLKSAIPGFGNWL
jgi:hypothetical protein